MADDTLGNGGGVSFTTKEMLIRMDGKLDVVIAKQQTTDLELALLKARLDRAEKDLNARNDSSESWRNEVRSEIEGVKVEQDQIVRKLAYATGTVAGIVVLANFFGPMLMRLLMN